MYYFSGGIYYEEKSTSRIYGCAGCNGSSVGTMAAETESSAEQALTVTLTEDPEYTVTIPAVCDNGK